MSVAVKVQSVSKRFELHRQHPRTLREWTVRWMKGEHFPRNTLWALKDISFEVGRGKTVGMIGQNGAGKSTLMRLICGISLPTSGSIQRFGTISGLLELGSGFHPMRSGRENIRTAAILNGLTKKEIDAIEKQMIEFAELEEFIDEPVRTYSSGMYLRLAFSAAIHLQPEIMVIDEVLAVGDLSFRKKCINRLEDFRRLGKSLLIASHDMDHITRLSDEVLVLDRGKLVLKANPAEAVKYYENLLNLRTDQRIATIAPAVSAAPIDQGHRRGTQEASILSVRILNEIGQVTEKIEHGSHLIVELDVMVAPTVPDFVLSLAIFTDKDVNCFETLVPSVKKQFGAINGNKSFRCRIPLLPLLPGRFYLNVGLYPTNWEFIYDYHWQMHIIQVTGEIQNVAGIMSLQSEWSCF